MFLSDRDILTHIENKNISIEPFNNKKLWTASYDIHLGNKFLVVKQHQTGIVDSINNILPKYEEIEVNDWDWFILHPWQTVLWVSLEKFWSDEFLIQLSGKSSLARLWLIVHNTAWFINPWHFLNITFELANMSNTPIVIRPGMEIAQLFFCQLSSKPLKSYKEIGRYGEWDTNFTGYKNK